MHLCSVCTQGQLSSDSGDGNEILLEITSSFARPIYFLCRIYLVLTKTQFHFAVCCRENCSWMNYCGGKIEDKQVQSTTVNERLLLLQGNLSASLNHCSQTAVCAASVQNVCRHECLWVCVFSLVFQRWTDADFLCFVGFEFYLQVLQL